VDDDAALRTALKFSLELEGFDVETFESGEALLLRDDPSGSVCLVMDLNLPGIDGLGVLRELRGRGINAPALLITSHPRPTVRAGAAAIGAVIVEKPLLGDHLVGAIHHAIGV
jgi:FixJ family two-component response regulator